MHTFATQKELGTKDTRPGLESAQTGCLPDAIPADAHPGRARKGGASRAGTILLAVALAGCGSPGPPQPPSLKLPAPPSDLSASRSGDIVTLLWTMPRLATDRVPLSGDQRAVICRGIAPGPCTVAGQLLLQPGSPASYRDSLPTPLTIGPPRLLTYTVLLENHQLRDAGPSNSAYAAAGAAPPLVTGLDAHATASGIVLHWTPSGSAARRAATAATVGSSGAQPADYLLRLQRSLVAAPEVGSPRPRTRAGLPQPAEQTLELAEARGSRAATLDEGWMLHQAIDRDAALNHAYRYTVERVARLLLDGHRVEVGSGLGTPVTVSARDIFPPAVPQGLVAVADVEAGAIDLSWSPDADPDLAGYSVYRRVAGSTTPAERVSGGELLSNPAWRDLSPRSGLVYAYSVSAVDQTGNESARSAEALESVIVTPAAAPGKLPGQSSPHS